MTLHSMVNAYLDTIRSYKLLQNAKENVEINEKIYNDVQELYNSGLTTKSEMTKIFGSLSLAKSNYVVQHNNTMDKEFRFKRLFGRDVAVSELEMPELDFAMPESIQRATIYALENNPSVLVGNYNIAGAQALYKERKSNFYPKIDIELEQLYNDSYSTKDNGYDRTDDRTKAYLVLNWNLYKGGADKASLQKTHSTIHKELESQRDIKRQTIESLELSWSAYSMIAEQLKELYKYKEYSVETLESYKSEYEMGRRTLLDLLSAQNDLNNSKAQIINAETDRLLAQYRILDAMGILVSALAGETQAYRDLLKPIQQPFSIVEDKLPVNLDSDNDGIVDSIDICQNSVNNNDILPYGCSQRLPDIDFDGVPDHLDRCPNTKFGVKVDEFGCEIEGAENKFNTNPLAYVSTPISYTDSSPLKNEESSLYDYEYSPLADKNTKSREIDNVLMYDNFELIKRYDSVIMDSFDENLSNELVNDIKKITDDIKTYYSQDSIITIIGHTKSGKLEDDGLKYASAIKQEMIANGINEENIITESRGFSDNEFLETRNSDSGLNNRAMIAVYIPKEIPVDSDNDGIFDTIDRCQNTPNGFKVDEFGCCFDDDSDGVVNELDMCPSTPDGYQVDDKGCSVKLNLQVLFENDSSVVMLHSLDRVERFKQFLLDHPHYNTVITGHTSKTKTSKKKYNIELSLKRAEAIKTLLVNGGVDSARIQTVGKGYDEPIATNDTFDGQAQNRRIEAEIIDTLKSTLSTNIVNSTNNSWKVDY